MSSIYQGLPAAPGIGLGALVIHRTLAFATKTPVPCEPPLPAERAPAEWQRFLDAQAAVDAELERMGSSLNAVAMDIFAIHQLILKDKTLTAAVRHAIFERHCTAGPATYQAVLEMAELFQGLDDDYFASRAADVMDIGGRLLRHLDSDLRRSSLADLPPGSVLIAVDLAPSEVAQLSPERVRGIALAHSTPTAHTAILARSLGLPLVCGLGDAILALEPGQSAILDGSAGKLIVNPHPEVVTEYSDELEDIALQHAAAAERAHEPAITRDGRLVPIYANANSGEDVTDAHTSGADGVGLLRTEYLFQERSAPPTVEEQARVYAALARTLAGRMLTVRALDIGGDKPVSYLFGAREENPFLGRRGVRLLLSQPQLLRDQFHALLLAAEQLPSDQPIRFMLPMVSAVREVEIVRHHLDDVLEQHGRANGRSAPPWARPIALGVLVEVPAAALLADALAARVDFFSLGTNDLAQYTLASDRTNASVAELADPLHPAVLTLIARACRAGQDAAIPVSLCGEMGAEPAIVPLLLGLGVTELSVPLPAVPLIKQVVRSYELAECRRLAEAALARQDPHEVRSLLSEDSRAYRGDR